jgi:hypothetical protein
LVQRRNGRDTVCFTCALSRRSASLKAFGIRNIKRVGRGGFAQAVHEALAGDAPVSELIDAVLCPGGAV